MSEVAMTPDRALGSKAPSSVEVASLRLDRRPLAFLVLCACHVPLAMAIFRIPLLGTVHALLTLIFGVGLALGARGAERAAGALAYIMGAEVLWRMTKTPIPWEFAKYASVLIMGCCIVRFRPFRQPLSLLVFFALLLPSAFVTLQSTEFGRAREFISFNLSGPLTLTLAVYLFSRLRLTTQGALKILLGSLPPTVGILTIILFNLRSHAKIHFTDESNFVTSGGFGPNQVAAALALSAVIGLLCAVLGRLKIGSRIIFTLTTIVVLAFSALTFSRGGVYLAAASLGLGSLYLLKDKRLRSKAVVIGAVVIFAASFWVIPGLNAYTGNQLARRFGDSAPTKRDQLIKEDLVTFVDHPILGVGPGLGALYRERRIAAHTEYTRLLAEHGIFGLAALVCLFLSAIGARRKLRSNSQLALITTLQVWVLLYMVIDGMRTFGPSFLFGFAFLSLVEPAGEGAALDTVEQAQTTERLRRVPFDNAVRHSP